VLSFACELSGPEFEQLQTLLPYRCTGLCRMTIHALFLTTHASQADLVRLFTKHCSIFDIASTFAQAAAIFSKSLDATTSVLPINLIVADVPAGGINLAEYVLGRIRPTAYFGNSRSGPRIIVIDRDGNVAAARRALQLGVTEYFLPADLTESKIDNFFTSWNASEIEDIYASHNDAPMEDFADSVDGDGHSRIGGRLSSVEAAIVNCLTASRGSPMSARDLVSAIMGRDVDEDHAANLIRPHISRLRSKVELTPQMPRRLLTVRGKGYMLVTE
jgi:hypothetical protein